MTLHRRQLVLAVGALVGLSAARRYFRDWGTTKEECRMRLPGDDLMSRPILQSTEGAWIEAPPSAVWPWLAQIGQDRGGLYSYQLLENSIGLHHHNADQVHHEWQHLSAGEVVRLSPRGWLGLSEGIALTVDEVVPDCHLVLQGEPPNLPWETVWSFHLIPHWQDRSRLLIRTRVSLRRPGALLLAELFGPVTALMTRGMLRGIRRRAEDESARAPQPVPLPRVSSR